MEALDEADRSAESVLIDVLSDSIAARLRLSDGYARDGQEGLALECLRSAWSQYVRFADAFRGSQAALPLANRLIEALVLSGDESLAGLAVQALAPLRPASYEAAVGDAAYRGE